MENTEKINGKKKFKNFVDKCVKIAEKIAQNRFVSSIAEGFIITMPVIIASTLFILVQNLPQSFGYNPEVGVNPAFDTFKDYCGVLYNLSYGLIGLALCISISSRLTEKISPGLKSAAKLNVIIVAIGTMIAYFMISAIIYKAPIGDETSVDVIVFEMFGAKGIFIGMITGLSAPWLFYLCYRYNITIRLPKQVPQNISQAFLNIFPLLFIMLSYGSLGFLIKELFGDTILNFIFNSISPLLEGAGNAWFFVLWSFVLSLTWFCGIHVSVWSAVTDTLNAHGIGLNIAAINSGERPTNLWTAPFQMGAHAMGGTGAQIAVPFIILLLCKSKQLKSIAVVACVPILFAVNEPILFGVPSILNPLIIIPFLATPIVNSIIGVVFMEIANMNGSYVAVPWSMPTFIALPISQGMQWMAFILPFIWFASSYLIYTPFILVQDNVYYKKEFEKAKVDNEFLDHRTGFMYLVDAVWNKTKHAEIKEKTKLQKQLELSAFGVVSDKKNVNEKLLNSIDSSNSKKILVVCQGAGTSAMVAENINKTFADSKVKIEAVACAIGNYSEYINTSSLVILSPQAKSIEKDMRAIEKDRKDLKVLQTKGNEFLLLLRDKQYVEKIILENLGDNENG